MNPHGTRAPRDAGGFGRAAKAAVTFGALAAVAIAAAGQAVAFAMLAFGGPGSLASSPSIGWLYTCAFLRAPLSLTSVRIASAEPLTGGFQVALLTGTGVAVLACAIAGRATARVVPKGVALPLVAGGAVGVVVAAIVLAMSALVRVTVALPENPLLGDVTVRPSLPGTLGWTLLIACLAGTWGGVLAIRERSIASRRAIRSLAAVEGGLRMLAWSLALGVAAVALLAVTRPDATAAYVRRVTSSGPGPAAATIGHHLLVLPNQSVWLLVPAMGGCDTIETGTVTIDAICLRRLPREVSLDLVTPTTGTPPQIAGAPWEFVLLPLIPAIACFLGGLHAARRSGARTPGQRVAAGALAGIVWALLVTLAAEAASLEVSGALLAGGAAVRYGPPVLQATTLALLWGVGAGSLGAALGPIIARRVGGEPLPDARQTVPGA